MKIIAELPRLPLLEKISKSRDKDGRFIESSLIYSAGIYMIKNTLNDKVYIGGSQNIYARRTVHSRTLLAGIHKNRQLQLDFDKQATEGFIFEVLEWWDFQTNLIEREQYWMDHLGACNQETGYNFGTSFSSQIGHPHSEEHRKKISESQIRVWQNPTRYYKGSK